ncbi:MAG: hypothetical protein AAFX94_00890, partial [Myxococcota bacterium]
AGPATRSGQFASVSVEHADAEQRATVRAADMRTREAMVARAQRQQETDRELAALGETMDAETVEARAEAKRRRVTRGSATV